MAVDAGRIRRHHGAQRFRQVDRDEHPRLPRYTKQRRLPFPGRGRRAADARSAALLRRHYLGFVFQGFNLLARTTALENVELPLIYRRSRLQARRHAMPRARRWRRSDWRAGKPYAGRAVRRPAAAGSHRARHRHAAGGAAGRRTDRQSRHRRRSREIMDLMAALNRDRGITVLMVTHEPDMAAYARPHCPFRRWPGGQRRAHRGGA
jgi:putative ABC transport system ATP-binding protein